MKATPFCLAVAFAITVAPAYAKAPNRPEYQQARKDMQALLRTDAVPITNSTVGDADSFGRNAKYIGLMSAGTILVQSDCSPEATGDLGPDGHCILSNPAPASTAINIPDAGRMIIPGKSSNSLFCHWQTPVVVYAFSNDTGVYQPNARIVLTPSYTFQNPVLDDPSLIDPTTGLPFGGSLTIGLSGIYHSRALQPGEYQVERDINTRSCIAGVISKRALMETYGLSDAQATNFFKNDTAVTMNLTGSVQLVDFAIINYGTRMLGD